MGKNLKKVIFSVLLLAAVIIVSPKDAKAAGKVWMAGFNDNSITIQWTLQSLNGYRVDGYYLEEIGTQRSIWQGSSYQPRHLLYLRNLPTYLCISKRFLYIS